MCEPMTMAVIAGTQALMENQMANKAYQHEIDIQEAGAKGALLAHAVEQRQLGTQTQQKMRSITEEINLIRRKANKVSATSAVRAHKAGIASGSTSVDALGNQFTRDALQAEGVADVKGQGILTFSQQQATAIRMKSDARIQATKAGPAPTWQGQTANVVLSAATAYAAAVPTDNGLDVTKALQDVVDPAQNVADLYATKDLLNFAQAPTIAASVAPAIPAFNPLNIPDVDTGWGNWFNPFAVR